MIKILFIYHGNLQKAVSLVQKARIIHLSAISYSLLLGQTFQLNMNRLGKLVNICPVEGEELFMNNLIQKEDCLLMISYSGQINQMLQLILDILYACYFDKDYEGNLNKRIHISKESETTRFASLDIMKESEP